jgi:hypothetical protein
MSSRTKDPNLTLATQSLSQIGIFCNPNVKIQNTQFTKNNAIAWAEILVTADGGRICRRTIGLDVLIAASH